MSGMAISPSISAVGSLSPVNTVFGTFSANPASFTVSGDNLTAGITVAPPAGFEVSAGNSNSFAGKGNSIIVGSSGTVANTTVFVRLAADTDVGTYSGNIVCSSVGASTVTVATVASTVDPKDVLVSADSLRKTYGNEDPELTYTSTYAAPFNGALTRDAGENVGSYRIRQGTLSAGSNYRITFTENDLEINRKNLYISAGNIEKIFGQTLFLGAGQSNFNASGLVNGESIGSVTITASGGTGASDAVGTYVLVPSAATGGNFSVSNYDAIYNSGTLTVIAAPVAVTLSEWASQNGLSGAAAAPDADPDGDGMMNLMEYYLGLSPTSFSGLGEVFTLSKGSNNTFSLTYRRAKGVTGVSSAVQATGDLSSSSSWGISGVQETVVDKGSYEEVTATVTNAPGETQKFMRLRVTTP
jgi:hypothetical protein